jgi:hypothetical protein
MPVNKKPQYDGNFTTLPNDEVVRNRDLTLKARGLLSLLLSFPHDWEFRMNDLLNRIPEEKYALRSGLDELEDHGFLFRVEKHRDDGGRAPDIWYVYDAPQDQDAPPHEDRDAPPRSGNQTPPGLETRSTPPRSGNQTPTNNKKKKPKPLKSKSFTKNTLQPNARTRERRAREDARSDDRTKRDDSESQNLLAAAEARGPSKTENQPEPDPNNESTPDDPVLEALDKNPIDPVRPDEPRLSLGQFQGVWRRTVGETLAWDSPEQKIGAKRLLDAFPADDIRSLLEIVSGIHRRWRWEYIALSVAAQHQIQQDRDVYDPILFIRDWGDVTGKPWPSSQLDRLEGVVKEYKKTEIENALSIMKSDADYPGWKFFRIVLEDSNERC